MAILLFANGDMPPDSTWLEAYFDQATVVVAADGGANHVIAAGHWPDLIIGDVDSWTLEEELPGREATIELVLLAKDKDETDLEAALHLIAEKEEWRQEPILLFGTLGGRLDQTMSNVLLLALPVLVGREVRLVEPYQTAWLVDDDFEIEGEPGDTVSLIPLGGDALVRETNGLRWKLEDEWLRFGPARGVSNEMTGSTALVKVGSGRLLCVHVKKSWGR